MIKAPPFQRLLTLRLGGALALFVILSVAAPACAAESGPKKKVVFVAGNPSHSRGEHEHRAGCLLFADHLNRSGLAVQAIVTSNGWPADESIFQGAAAVVIYADGGASHPAFTHLDELRKLAKNGVGIGCIHYAVEMPPELAGGTLRDVIGGYFETGWSVNPHWQADFKIPPHEITRGIRDYKMTDEWYYHLRFSPEMRGVTPILTALPPPESLSRPDGPHEGNPYVRVAVLDRKQPQHVMWAYDRREEFGSGRSFGYTGGHFHKNWQQDDNRRVVLNAIAWIARLEIPAKGLVSLTPSAAEMAANLDVKP